MRTSFPLSLLSLLALLPAALGAAEERIVFPADAGVIDVTKAPYNAVADGTTDCSDAIQKALDDYGAQNRIIYLPAGTYLVSHTLEWGPSTRLHPGKEFRGDWGEVQRLTILQGESRDTTVIRLVDHAPEFQDAVWRTKEDRPGGRPLVYTGGWPAQRFRNAVRNLTLDTGSGNPGAIGIQFNASNQGTMHRLLVRSGDGQGTIGIDIGYCGDHGPGAGRHLEVKGFDYGVWAGSMNSMTLWDVVLSGQRKAGVQAHSEVLILGQVRSDNTVPALAVGPGFAFVTLVGGTFSGGTAAGAAVLIEKGARDKHVFCRDVTAKGYGKVVAVEGEAARDVATGPLVEWSLQGYQHLFAGDADRTLRLPAKDAPEVPWDPVGKAWANPIAFGATGDGKADDTDGIQTAIDSGASTIYFPGGKTFTFKAITIKASTRRLVGCETYLNGDLITVAQAGPPLIFERFIPSWNNGRSPRLSIEAPRTVVLRDLVGFETHQRSAGELFIEDVCATLFMEKAGAKTWCRFFNYEPEKTLGIVNDGGDLWLLGGKAEHPGPKVVLKNGSRTELLGAWWYASFGEKVAEPGILVEDSSLAVTCHRQFSFGTGAWPTWIKAVRKGETKVWSDWNLDCLVIGTPAEVSAGK